MKTCNLSKPILALSFVGMLLGANPALGDVTVPLGGGWEATVPDLSQVGIVVDSITTEFIAIELSKDFTVPYDGVSFASLSILFTQVGSDASTAPNIVILDEAVTNLTGSPWTDYHMHLDTTGDVEFNIAASLGFSMAPFTIVALGLTDLDASGGSVAHNSSFFPGAGPGELVIAADLEGDPVTFTLEEVPTPEPSTLALMALGLGCLARRRSRMAKA
jgi:PEP-CTERM motif-containing protein